VLVWALIEAVFSATQFYPTSMYTLCTTLRRMRGLFGYSQEFVAGVAGISQPNYCKIESGKVKPGLPVLTNIAALYHISLGDLLEKDSLILIQQVTQNPNFVHLWGGVNNIICSYVWGIGKRGKPERADASCQSQPQNQKQGDSEPESPCFVR
jgi:transcriptional regulator with XRE-family HTH domain